MQLNTKGVNVNIFEQLHEWRVNRNLSNLPYDHKALLGFILEEVVEGIRDPSEHQSVDWRCDIIVFLINSLAQSGYNPELAMLETVKEISSRQGSIDPTTGKWEKQKDQPLEALYKADYSKCRYNNVDAIPGKW